MSDTDMLHLSAMEAENMKLWNLLKETQPILRAAFFAHHEQTSKANELYDRISEIVGRE